MHVLEEDPDAFPRVERDTLAVLSQRTNDRCIFHLSLSDTILVYIFSYGITSKQHNHS